MKQAISFLLLLLIVFSCQKKQNESSNISSTQENEVAFDSIYYFLLRDGYATLDTAPFNIFFEIWHKQSLKMQSSTQDKMAIILNDIFIEIYHPFNFEKYGWLGWEKQTQYEYAILPSAIKYKITNSKYDINDVFEIEMDTLESFYPNPDIGSVKKLYDMDPFKKSMKLFLENDGFEKLLFLDINYFINNPTSYNGKRYETSPSIIGILINKKLNYAVAYIRLVSTILSIELSFDNKKWTVKKITEGGTFD